MHRDAIRWLALMHHDPMRRLALMHRHALIQLALTHRYPTRWLALMHRDPLRRLSLKHCYTVGWFAFLVHVVGRGWLRLAVWFPLLGSRVRRDSGDVARGIMLHLLRCYERLVSCRPGVHLVRSRLHLRVQTVHLIRCSLGHRSLRLKIRNSWLHRRLCVEMRSWKVHRVLCIKVCR